MGQINLYKSKKHHAAQDGFTLIELIVVTVIIAILAGFALFLYRSYLYKAELISAVSDITNIEKELFIYTIDHGGSFPPDLSEIDYQNKTDPWGNAYVYNPDLTLSPRTKVGLNINTDFDLYSLGKDGLSAADIGAAISADDLIRADNGTYKGKASGY